VPSHQGAQAPAADAPRYRAASAADVDAIARLHALHVLPDNDARSGALVDHLHVSAALKRHGVGTRLLVEAARELARRPTHGALYLWVLDQNKAAQALYAARGGVRMQTTIRGPFPGAGTARGHRVAWTNPTHHLAQRAWRGRGLSRRRRTTRVRRRTIG
jgi:GNAT superfamily N-acetyltransferase